MFLIHAVLVDDDEISLMALEYALSRYCPEVKIIAKYESPVEALKWASARTPDLVFLDIKMEEMSGIELAKRFNTMSVRTVFVSSYGQFALQALRVSAVDFLMKPVDPSELMATVSRTRLAILSRGQKLQAVVRQARVKFPRWRANQYVALPTIRDITIADMTDILYCEGMGNYTKVVLRSRQEITLSKTLALIEIALDSELFVRIHNKFLINFIHVAKLVRKKGGAELIMPDGREIPVSKSRRKYFMSKVAVLS